MGIIFEKYRTGINLGGWISQSKYEKEHIAEFIKREDVERIASWGLDHIRLPFDYPVLENDSNPFHYLEEGFEVIDKTLAWCKEFSLNLILDMHRAPGYAFYNLDTNTFFTSENDQNRFVSLWQEFARRYKSEGGNLIFELLNEIVDAHGDTWNKIARKAIEGIREIDSERYILLGGSNYNSAESLEGVDLYDDERIIYNFHFYEPFIFTHQRAVWTPLKDVNIEQPYPGKIAGIDLLKKHFGSQRPEQGKSLTADTVFDKAYLENGIAPAVKFAVRTGKQLYCGEYGAIDNAATEHRVNYIRDINEILDKYGIGRACWTYKGKNFASIDEAGNPISKELVKALAKV
ncbi:MAG: glycoside hydrolase family 5 protein [Oscillospiraceae bacterium]|nr:glycoside hydrolase family 5 protein [Oscillospiraceae bacterium]